LLLHWDLTRFASSSLVSTFSHRHAWISAPLLFDHLHTRIRRNATFDTGFKSLYLRSISNMKRCTAFGSFCPVLTIVCLPASLSRLNFWLNLNA